MSGEIADSGVVVEGFTPRRERSISGIALRSPMAYMSGIRNHKGEVIPIPERDTGELIDVPHRDTEKLLARMRHYQRKGENLGYMRDKGSI